MEAVGGSGSVKKVRWEASDSCPPGCRCTCYCQSHYDSQGLCDQTFYGARNLAWT